MKFFVVTFIPKLNVAFRTPSDEEEEETQETEKENDDEEEDDDMEVDQSQAKKGRKAQAGTRRSSRKGT